MERAKQELYDCGNGVDKLEKKLEKLRTHPVSNGFQQKVWAEVQRLHYPFKESTLAKLREIAVDLRGRLALMVQVLQLDLSTRAQNGLSQLDGSVARVISQTQDILTAQQADQFRKIVDWLSPPATGMNVIRISGCSNPSSIANGKQDHSGTTRCMARPVVVRLSSAIPWSRIFRVTTRAV